ncbi:hypothetical protein GW931_01590 [archaeon]|nr:hypothetical protein [archaeon]
MEDRVKFSYKAGNVDYNYSIEESVLKEKSVLRFEKFWGIVEYVVEHPKELGESSLQFNKEFNPDEKRIVQKLISTLKSKDLENKVK